MNLHEVLAGRLSGMLVEKLSCEIDCPELYAMVGDEDERVGYNALWVITHWADDKLDWLKEHRNELMDRVLSCTHTGQRRLMMTILERMAFTADDVRSDFLDFCLGRINSTEPYGVRSLAMKLAYAQCRFYPELIAELLRALELLDIGDSSPALMTTRRNILKQIKPRPAVT